MLGWNRWVLVWVVPAIVAGCGGTSRPESGDSPGGRSNTSSSGAGLGGAAGQAVAGGGGNGGSMAGGRGGTEAGSGGAHAGSTESGGTAGISAGRAGMGGAVGQGGTLTTVDSIKPTLEAYCSALSNCCSPSSKPVDLPTCEANYIAESPNYASLVAGRVSLDATVLAKCRAAYSGADRCNVNAVLAACRDLFVGKSGVGGPCSQGYDCDRSQGEMTCLVTGDCNVNPMGVCTSVPHAKAGEKCLATCYTGSGCSSTTCGVGETNALCFEDDGLYCEYFSSGAICRAITPLGSNCSSSGSQECGSEAYCDATCKPLSKLGKACGYGCSHELQCGPDNKCMDPLWDDEYSCKGYAPGL
jgi:hypothetical protein